MVVHHHRVGNNNYHNQLKITQLALLALEVLR
ncbi:MAG: hypothetical protein JWM21_892 [Acidobacteria bacterium]|nr:hypothetical protein [Acidobacteriota bacterium]